MSVDELKQQIMKLTNEERAQLQVLVNAMGDKDAAQPEQATSAPFAEETDN